MGNVFQIRRRNYEIITLGQLDYEKTFREYGKHYADNWLDPLTVEKIEQRLSDERSR